MFFVCDGQGMGNSADQVHGLFLERLFIEDCQSEQVGGWVACESVFALFDEVGQGAAVNQWHGEIGAAIGLAELINGQNGRVYDPGRPFGLFAQLYGIGFRFDADIQDLERHHALDGNELDGSINGPLPTEAKLAVNDERPQAFLECGERGMLARQIGPGDRVVCGGLASGTADGRFLRLGVGVGVAGAHQWFESRMRGAISTVLL